MKASKTDHPFTRPVALRTNIVRSMGMSALAKAPPFLAGREHEALDLLAVELDQRAEQLPLLVRAAWVDAQGAANASVAAGLVDVAVEGERRLRLLDRRAYRLRADRLRRVAAVLRRHILVQPRRVVEPRRVRGAVQVEDDALGRVREPLRHAADPLEQHVLGLLTVGVPRGHVRPACGCHLVVADLDDPPLGELDPARGREDVVDLELVVVPGAHEDALRVPGELLLGHRHPPLDRPEHLLVEEVVEPLGVGLELGELVRGRAKRVVAAPDHVLLEGRDGVLAGEVAALLLERPMPSLAAVVDDRDERLAGHVAAGDHHVGLVVRAGVQELAPARLGPMDVRREEDPHAARDCRSRAGRNQSVARETSRVGKTRCSSSETVPSMHRSSRPVMARVIAASGWRTVVSGGSADRASGMSSKPTTATSEGTSRPAAASAWSAPTAIRSLAAKTPSRSGCRRRSAAIARRPLSGLKSPFATRPLRSRTPCSARAAVYPSRRSSATAMSSGPVIVATLRRPCESRWPVARSAPPRLSASTDGSRSPARGRPNSTAGMRAPVSARGSGSAPCSDTRMTPSTWPWRR